MRRISTLMSKLIEKRFELLIFIITFFSFGTLITIQMFILGDYINYKEVETINKIAILLFWIVTALSFTMLTIRQINRRYKDPIQQFAKATKKVANGDFSIYLSQKTTSGDRHDYLDRIFEDFNKMVEALGSIETLKTDFISNVSHEIKTPLAIIQNYAEILQKDNLTNEQRKEYASNIVKSTHRLTELITNILRLNKLENQTIRPLPVKYDVCEQLCNCALQYEDLWEAKNIEFIAEIEDRVIIEADESLLEIVWNNLLANAIKFTEIGGIVTLTQIRTADEVVVKVVDTGCGMEKETSQHIFEKFYQCDASHATEGNGLGLALVTRILQLIGGTIIVDSTLGKGTCFTVSIPSVNFENTVT